MSRANTVAYARKTRLPGDPGGPEDEDEDGDAANDAPAAAATPSPAPAAPAAPPAAEITPPAAPSARAAQTSSPAIVPPVADATPPVPAPTTPPSPAPIAPPAPRASVSPEPAAAAEPPRARSSTVAMSAQSSIGAPPAMPPDVAPIAPPIEIGATESPTQLPGPREIPTGNPEDPAAAPGIVPRGDSRSLRRRAERYEFALIYRVQTFIITRSGVVGTRGQWRVVEYPTSASAGHAYAKEVSRFVSDGFSDYRE